MLRKSCHEFVELLASSDPTPGGGGASAFAGVLGVALAGMVANLTRGKKKYATYEQDIHGILGKCGELQKNLTDLVQRDAEVFAPLSKAYAMPANTEHEREHKAAVMEDALVAASLVPLEIMEQAYEGLLIQEELAEKGSRLAISDVGVGVQLLKAAILGASMNIFINTKSMADRHKAEEIEENARKLIAEGTLLADRVYGRVEEILR